MKKLIILFIVSFCSVLYSQSFDSTNFALALGKDGYYSELVNRNDYYGNAAGSVRIALNAPAISIDTALFSTTVGDGGYKRYAVNKSEWMGMPAGTVRILLTYDINTTNYTQYSVDLGSNGNVYDMSANNEAIEITYTNTETSRTITASSTQTIVISNSTVNANSKVVVTIQDYTNGLPVIIMVKVITGLITLAVKNIDSETDILSFTIRIFKTN